MFLMKAEALFLPMPLTLPAPSLADRLKEETALLHQETENLLAQKLLRISTTVGYTELLLIFYGYYAPVEQQVQAYLPPQLQQAVELKKTSWLQKDLAALGHEGEKPIAATLPTVNSAAEAFGCLYVLEGSTLGGRIILKMLKKQIPSLQDGQLTFFNGYGAATGTQWQQFKSILDTYQAESQQVIAAANETFLRFQHWIKQRLNDE